MTHAIRMITFDLDNTLWPVDPVIDRANQVLCDWLAENVAELSAGVPVAGLERHRKRVLASQPELSQFVTRLRLAILEDLLVDAGVPNDAAPEVAREAFDIFLHARHRIDYHPHAIDLLRELAEHYTIVALSNGNAEVHRLAIGEHFAFALSAESIGAGKPDPAMFLQACERAACDPDQALHVGDHPEHDVLGGHRAGLHTLWVNREGRDWLPEHGQRPSAEVRCLSEIPTAVAALNRKLRNL